MAAAKLKGRKSKGRSILCSFRSCFGFSNKVSADHGDGKPVSRRQKRGAPPVNDQSTPTPSSNITTFNKEIQLVEDDEKKRNPSTDDHLMSNIKTGDGITSEKQNSAARETWTNRRKLSHSVSLPLPHQGAAAVVGENKGENGKECAVGGEFDSMVGAVIITVTLIVMVIWGKIYASLCTAACFYLIPRFRAIFDRSHVTKIENGNRVDFDSNLREHSR